MKKYLVVVLFLCILSLGCIGRFSLSDEYYGFSGINNVSGESLSSLLNSNKSFMLYVYKADSKACSSFREILDDFSNEYSIKVISISYDELQKIGLDKEIGVYPSLAFFKDGEFSSYVFINSSDIKNTNDVYNLVGNYINLKK